VTNRSRHATPRHQSVDAVGWVADISSAKEALISCRQARAQAVEQSKTDDSKTAAKILQDRSPPMNDRRRGFHRQESVSGLISARDTVTQQIEAIEQEIAELDNNRTLLVTPTRTHVNCIADSKVL